MSRHYRIGIGGIAFESSTFSPLHSTTADFHILRGEEIVAGYPYFENGTFEGREDVSWFGTLKARAIPGGAVATASYLEMKNELLERLEAVLPLDGFFFDIHGAMSVVGMDDAEGDLVAAIRKLVGPNCIISTGMDLHGNVTAQEVENIDIFTAYRQAPHVDAMETKARAVHNLLACLDSGTRPYRAWQRIPVGLPGERTSTFWEPGMSVYGKLTESDVVPGVLDASLWVGYVWADQPRNSATTVVTGTDPDAIAAEATKIAKRYWDARAEFDFGVPTGDSDWTIAEALKSEIKPVVISDSGDNPTAGGAGDIPLMAQKLLAVPEIASGEKTALLASLMNAKVVEEAKAAGVGAEITVTLGGVNDPVNGFPLEVTGTVHSIHPSDTIMGGDIAIIKSGGLYILVPQRRIQFGMPESFDRFGIDLHSLDIIVIKIGYLDHEWEDLTPVRLLALTPGAVNQDIVSLPFQRVQRPFYPLDADMAEPEWAPQIFAPIGE
ncbi:MAG: M81 family metallopeptidase [Thermomicrobiales bacterium]|nr:M81 family metallopeptidase [Thermomicrobiales bacterium]